MTRRTPNASEWLPTAVVYLAGFAGALNVGKLPPSLPALQRAFDMTLLQASLLVSAFQVFGMALGMFGGLLADRFGARRLMGTGLALLALASAAGTASTGATTLLACRALESAGFILTVLPGPVLMRRLLPPQRMSVALGAWGSYMPAGMVTAMLATPWLLQAGGWSAAWWACAGASAGVLALLLAYVPPDAAHGHGTTHAHGVPHGPGAPRVHGEKGPQAPPGIGALARATLASPGPWLLAMAFGLYAGQWMVVFSFLPTIYEAGGVAPPAAASLSALGVAVNVIGNVAAGGLVARGASRTAVLGVASATMALGAWVAFGTGLPFAWRYFAVLAFSCVGGLVPGTLFTTAPRFAPHAGAVSTTTGLMQQGSNIGQFVTPPLVATVVGTAGQWQHTWWVTSVLACANLGVALAIGRLDRELRARAPAGAHA